MNKTKKRKSRKRSFTRKQYSANDGMMTAVWGPTLWHYLHMTSFNYPVNPTKEDKKHYRDMILNLQHTLPCKYCRVNLKKNFKTLPLRCSYMKNRDTFSRYVYELHEVVNKMLCKNSGLTYCDVRERYEHFRARCSTRKTKNNKTRKKENGCTEPLYGKKAKCILKIVPQEKGGKTFQMDKQCKKKKVN